MKNVTTKSKRAYVAPALVNLGEVKNLTKSTKGSVGNDGGGTGFTESLPGGGL